MKETKECPKCEKTKPHSAFYKDKKQESGLRCYCKDCCRSEARKWRDDNKDRATQRVQEWRENPENRQREIETGYAYRQKFPEKGKANVQRYLARYPEKARAGSQLNKAVSRGKLFKPTLCEGCREEKGSTRLIDGHHHDYSKPLEVEWLCRQCHIARHHPKTETPAPKAR